MLLQGSVVCSFVVLCYSLLYESVTIGLSICYVKLPGARDPRKRLTTPSLLSGVYLGNLHLRLILGGIEYPLCQVAGAKRLYRPGQMDKG